MLPCSPIRFAAALACAGLPLLAAGQPAAGWQACAGLAEAGERLACFDRWAESQRAAPAMAATPAPPGTLAMPASPTPPALASQEPPASVPPPAVVSGPWRDLQLTTLQGCRNTAYSELSRFWELEPGTDCGTFGLRGYRPITMAVATANTVNRQPTSGNPLNNVATAVDYRTTEARLQLSVRTKLASGLLTRLFPDGSDSLWLAYTQQSYWQIFTPQLSRPFRSTDHEPEVLYVMPLQSARPGEWRLRYGGIAVAHQSNGQSLPWSRSWNRASLMAGAEKGPFQLQARLWKRTEAESQDDNPGITSFIGRGELRGSWQANQHHLFAATLRHPLRREGRGSVRLEWFRSLGSEDASPTGGLQLHTQLFSGYGDTLLDYNRRRTVLSVGLSLVDW